MANSVIQTSFNAGEWAPALNARVDIAKYHSGAALLRNFFVDYRGGATTRPGTRYVNQALATTVRLIPFQASQTVSYALEFSNLAIRFYNNGAPVVEAGTTITGITNANPGVVTDTGHGYSNGQWVFITGVVGMTGLNGNYFIVAGVTANTFTLQYLDGTAVDTTAFGTYTSGGTAQRVYTLTSIYTASELSQIKFAQSVNTLILCHPNHPPYQLVLNTATSWSLTAITFGATIAAPTTPAVTTTLAAGTVNYAYVITAVDSNGQESPPSSFAVLANVTDLRTVAGTNTVTWTASTGAASYNIYKAEPRYGAAVPAGAQFGFVGNCTATTFVDSNILQDFAQGPPVVQNPFAGTGIQSITVTAAGSYSNGALVPTVSFTGGGGGSGAAATAYAGATSVTISNGGSFDGGGGHYAVGETLTLYGGVVVQITSTGPPASGYPVTGITVVNAGSLASGTATNTNPTGTVAQSGGGAGATFNVTWGITSVGVTSPGTGYTIAPGVVFSSGAATATATTGTPSSGNPTVPGFFQQRMVLAGPVSSPQQFNMSQTGAYYNFDINNPLEAADAIQGTLVSGQLSTIQSLIAQPQGLIVLSDRLAWLINGGGPGTPVSPLNIVANPQAYNGATYLPPIVATDNILYVQAKGSIVRDLVFNFYTQIYTGTDISVLSSHLFYNYQLLEWAWSEEPFKIVWAIRNDGVLLSLTFLREQELIAWAHSDTNGAFKSICTITENTNVGKVDAVYTAVQRTTNAGTVTYIERFTELTYPNDYVSSWQVDAGLNYTGSATTTFSGARHLAGMTVTGVADGAVIAPFTMPANGSFTLGTAAANVTIGLGFTAQLQTLALDVGEPTVQGKRKKISAVTVRVRNALGLQIGGDSSALVNMKDLVLGNVGSQTGTVVSGLVTGDARTILDPRWTVPGQYFIQQSNPYPASILGVIPEIEVGDTPK